MTQIYRKYETRHLSYYKEKIIGGIYDDRFLEKPAKSATELMPNATYEELPPPKRIKHGG